MSQTGLSHAVGPTDAPLLERTIGDDLHATAERYPDREALVVRHQECVGYASSISVSTSRRALSRGLSRGDRIWAQNCRRGFGQYKRPLRRVS